MFRGNSKEPSQRNAYFCVFKRTFFVRLGLSVKLEENNNFFSILFATKCLLTQLLKVHCEMSETRAHFVLKEWILKWVPICK